MLVMMLFFTFLTWHTKECDPHTTFTDVDTYAIDSSAAMAKIPQAQENENITILEQNADFVTIREVKKPQCVDDCGCFGDRSEEHTSELQSRPHLVCRLLLEKKNTKRKNPD